MAVPDGHQDLVAVITHEQGSVVDHAFEDTDVSVANKGLKRPYCVIYEIYASMLISKEERGKGKVRGFPQTRQFASQDTVDGTGAPRTVMNRLQCCLEKVVRS
jgi:hypothetical protein